ncbi:MAG: hypothetical protein ACLQVY_26230 [Limisphaerales bacterium]
MLQPIRCWLAVAVVALSGCANHPPEIHVQVPVASLNSLPARTMVDTGGSSTAVFGRAARRMGLKSGQVSAPVHVVINRQAFTAPLPVFRYSWIIRLVFSRRMRRQPDLLVGWPEIRDNILVFDSERQTIRAASQLPPETANWTKLRVIPNDWLLLEVPLADGKKGTAEVDTGSAFGVQLPPEEWKQWRKAHPKARVSSRLGGVASFGMCWWHDAWTEEFKLGPIDLTDLSVQNMPASQAAFLRYVASNEAVCTIGMNVLNRLDLVVDGSNHVAYVHPRPPPGPAYPSVKRLGAHRANGKTPGRNWNWTLADDVPLKTDHLYVLSGKLNVLKHNLDAALADYGRALGIDSNNAEVFSRRGVARQIIGDFAGAVSDYDQAIRLDPDGTDWERLYRQTLLWRVGRAPEPYATTLANCKDGWTQTLGHFLAQDIDERALLAAAEKRQGPVNVPGQKSLALYYIAMARLSKGDSAGTRDYLLKYLASGAKDDDEWHFANAELVRLNRAR